MIIQIDIEIKEKTIIKVTENVFNDLQNLKLIDMRREVLVNTLISERLNFNSNIFKIIYMKYPELEKYNLKYEVINNEGYITILSKKIEKTNEK